MFELKMQINLFEMIQMFDEKCYLAIVDEDNKIMKVSDEPINKDKDYYIEYDDSIPHKITRVQPAVVTTNNQILAICDFGLHHGWGFTLKTSDKEYIYENFYSLEDYKEG